VQVSFCQPPTAHNSIQVHASDPGLLLRSCFAPALCSAPARQEFPPRPHHAAPRRPAIRLSRHGKGARARCRARRHIRPLLDVCAFCRVCSYSRSCPVQRGFSIRRRLSGAQRRVLESSLLACAGSGAEPATPGSLAVIMNSSRANSARHSTSTRRMRRRNAGLMTCPPLQSDRSRLATPAPNLHQARISHLRMHRIGPDANGETPAFQKSA
jgi:hypothetical protein